MQDKIYKLRYLPLFEQDLLDTVTYISKVLKNEEAAMRLINDVETAILARLNNPVAFEPYHSRKKREYPYYRIYVKNYVIYDEDTLRASGALDNMTFDEYIAANSDPVKTTVDQDNYTMIANATGFPEANISIIAYDEPIFQYSSGGRTLSDYLQIILAVLILLLLGYVVFRSTRKEKQAEKEEDRKIRTRKTGGGFIVTAQLPQRGVGVIWQKTRNLQDCKKLQFF